MDKQDRNLTNTLPRLIAAVFILAGIMILYFFGFPRDASSDRPNQPETTTTPNVAPQEGSLAPDFTLVNINNREIHLEDLRGQPILLNFWATWCAPCRIEMPAIQDRFERYQEEGLVVLAIDFDEPLEEVISFGEEFGLTFELLLDPGGKIQRLYRIPGYPTSFFVDAQGVIQVQHIGVMTESQLDDHLAQIGIGD